MPKIYFRRIIAGDITINDVPKRYRAAVEKLLEEYNVKEN